MSLHFLTRVLIEKKEANCVDSRTQNKSGRYANHTRSRKRCMLTTCVAAKLTVRTHVVTATERERKREKKKLREKEEEKERKKRRRERKNKREKERKTEAVKPTTSEHISNQTARRNYRRPNGLR